jgi:hypothetical protein
MNKNFGNLQGSLVESFAKWRLRIELQAVSQKETYVQIRFICIWWRVNHLVDECCYADSPLSLTLTSGHIQESSIRRWGCFSYSGKADAVWNSPTGPLEGCRFDRRGIKELGKGFLLFEYFRCWNNRIKWGFWAMVCRCMSSHEDIVVPGDLEVEGVEGRRSLRWELTFCSPSGSPARSGTFPVR